MQTYSIVIVLISILVSAFSELVVHSGYSGLFSLGYKTESYTKELCMSECINNKCITGWDMIKKPCVHEKGSERLYNLTLPQKGPKCWSRCGKFGYDYNWCFVNEKGNWDYCSIQNEERFPLGLEYTNELCMSECVDRKCFTGWDMVEKPCVKGNETTHFYYTALTQKIPICWTRCGTFGYPYEWCFVNEIGDWDYCSSETKNVQVQRHFTVQGRPCREPCKLDSNNEYKCRCLWKYNSWCNPKIELKYVLAKTIYGVDCAKECTRCSDSYYQCYDMKRQYNYCAPPAGIVDF